MSSLLYGILACLLCYQIGKAQVPDHRTPRTVPARGSRGQRAQDYLAQAQLHTQEGRTAEAQRLLSQAIAARHDLSEAYWLRAALKREAGDLAGAIVDYSVVIHQQPERHEARFQRAITQYEAQRYEAARQDFQYLLDHPTGETNTLYFKGATSADDEFVATAATTLQSDVRSDLLNYLGLCYWHLRDFVRAHTYFTQAATHRPEEPLAYINLGLTAEVTGDTLRAIDHYRRALRRAPGHPVALRNLSSLARQLNDTTLEKEVSFAGGSSSYEELLQRGMYHQRQGDYETAIRSFTQALEASPRQPEALVQRGFAYEKVLRTPEALADYTQAIRLDPRTEKAYSNRGNVYFREEKYASALADYNRALTLVATNATVWYNRGLTHYRLGNQEAACRDLQQAQALGHPATAKPLATICGDSQ